jgi:hypothetical protein
MHIAFSAPTRAHVDAFFDAALAAGARDDGGPGVRAHYHPSYYAAFVIDPLGHSIEAVCHAPPQAPPKRAAKAGKPRAAVAAKKAAPPKKATPAKKAPAKKQAPVKKKKR